MEPWLHTMLQILCSWSRGVCWSARADFIHNLIENVKNEYTGGPLLISPASVQNQAYTILRLDRRQQPGKYNVFMKITSAASPQIREWQMNPPRDSYFWDPLPWNRLPAGLSGHIYRQTVSLSLSLSSLEIESQRLYAHVFRASIDSFACNERKGAYQGGEQSNRRIN